MTHSEETRMHPFSDHEAHPLHLFFHPKNVAIIGAKEEKGSVGHTVLSNLKKHYKGSIYPVNPKYATVLGLKTFAKVQDIKEQVDLAIILTASKIIPDLIDDCARACIKNVIIISAGFKEIGPEGKMLEEEVLKRAQKGGIRILGPNCLGLMNPHIGLNATFAADIAAPGKIAFLSQSGALCTAVLDWSLKSKVGFSGFVSTGSMSDVNWADLIDYFGKDPHTSSILIYMESLRDAPGFISAVRAVTLNKPIIILKPGRTDAAAKTAVSHTGSLAVSDDVFDAALARAGAFRIKNVCELFNMAHLLATQPFPKGPKLAILTNAGGPAVLATDAAVLNGASISSLSEQTMERLNAFLPFAWSHNNPVDVLGDADATRYEKALEALLVDPNVDGILVILTPQAMTDPVGTARALSLQAAHMKKPILASFMGSCFVEEGSKILNDCGIPVFTYPDEAAESFALLWALFRNREKINRPQIPQDSSSSAFRHIPEKEAFIKELFDRLKKEGRTLLTESESKKLVSFYGIPVVETHVATSPLEASLFADQIGYPVVLKLHSMTITHKSDVGGVKLNIQDEPGIFKAYQEIEKAVKQEDFLGVTVQKMEKMGGYELILGSTNDATFGPVILFGSGGTLVEVFKDRSLALPPLSPSLALDMMRETKIFQALEGARGKKVDLNRLQEVLCAFSQMLEDLPQIKEADINPLIASSDKIVALDARIVMHDFNKNLPKGSSFAIRPYPVNYVAQTVLKNGLKFRIRPICPSDASSLKKELLKESMSPLCACDENFLKFEKWTNDPCIAHLCYCDYARDLVFVGEIEDKAGAYSIVSIGMLNTYYGTKVGHVDFAVLHDFQNIGVGTQMMQHILKVAQEEGLTKLTGLFEISTPIADFFQKYGFGITKAQDIHVFLEKFL